MYQVLLSLHVLFAIFWFGSVLFSDFVVIPAVQGMPSDAQHKFVTSFTPRLNRSLIPGGALTILSGIAVGLVSGVLGNLGTSYGRDWLLALAAALLTYLWGVFVITPNVEKMNRMAPDSPDLPAQTNRIKTLGMVELLGFALVFVLMMVMRFGG